MATRRISTVMAIQGENEYRSAMTRINGEIKSLQSSLKLTESQYQNNANSMQALSEKGKALANLYSAQEKKVKELQSALENAKKAEKQFTDQKAALTAQIDRNNKRLLELKKTTGDTSEEQAKLTKENEDLAAQLQRCDASLDAAKKGVNSWQTQLNNAQVKLNDLDAEVKLNKEYMQEAEKSADGCASSIDRFGNRIEKSSQQADELRDALMAAGVVAALKATADALEACAKSSIAYESAMAGVAKTTDMSGQELADMGRAIKELSTEIPGAATEIAAVAESAGQLGIAKSDLIEFSSVMINLGVATNLSSEEAASALAKFANVVGMSADKYENLGSVIVDLGNHFATTEADIVSMATRLASTGSIVGLTEPQIMAVATALSAVGIEAEAGGSAISKLLKQFETMIAVGDPALESFADVAGISADEFAQKWGQDAVGALNLFLNGLGKVDASGGSAVAVLDNLGITEVRLSNAVLALASSHGILGKTLDTAETAWTENTALAKEAATRYETTESKLQMLANSADNVKVAIGDKLNPAVNKFTDAGIEATKWLADAIEKSGPLVPMLTASATAVGVLATAIVGYTAVTKLATGATKLFSAVMPTNHIYLVASAVAALTAGIAVFCNSIETTVPSVKELTTEATELRNTLDESKATMDETEHSTLAAADVAERYIARLEELESTGLKTNDQQKEYHNILTLLCNVVPELSDSIDLETNTIEGGTAALRKNTEAWKQNAVQQAYQKRLTEIHEEYADVLLEQAENELKLTEAEERRTAASEEVERIQKRMGELYAEATQAADNQIKVHGELRDVESFLTDEYYQLENALNAANAEMVAAACDADAHQKALEADSAAVANAESEIGLMEDAISNLTESVNENTEAAQTSQETAVNYTETVAGIREELETLATSYKDAYDSAYDSISGQIGLFDKFSADLSKDTDTVEEMMTRWAEQTEALGKYTENLKLAAEYGLDDGLIASLSDGSAESAAYLEVIIGKIKDLGGTAESLPPKAGKFINEFNGAFEKTSEAKKTFADTVASMETGLDDAIERMQKKADSVNFDGFSKAAAQAFDEVGVKFAEIGSVAGTGLEKGISQSADKAKNASGNMAEGIISAAKEKLTIQDRSVKMVQFGQTVSDSLTAGISENAPHVIDAAEKVTQDLSEILQKGACAGAEVFARDFGQIVGKTNSTLNNLRKTLSDGAAPFPGEMREIGENTVNGMIAGMKHRSGALYNTVENIVSAALRTAAKAAEVASPSKKTTRMFEFVGDGMVKGLENRRDKVMQTSRRVVDDALNMQIKIPRIDDRMPRMVTDIRMERKEKDESIAKLTNAVDELGKKVKDIAAGGFVFDGDTIVGKWVSKIDRELGNKEALRARGVV